MLHLLTHLQAAVGDAYIIERELGGGGMSRLFVARERSLDRQVVLKLLPAELAHPVSVERFRREIMLVARLQHPHIVPIIGTGSNDGLSWYVMPYISGESLRQRLERDGALPIDEAVRLLREIGDALSHAHRSGVVHRDIKPPNILLSDGHAVVADFGVAQVQGQSQSGTLGNLTGTGHSLGTPGYMAPEQLSGESNIDARADIYALALVGYEMLTGEPPFAGLSGGTLMAAHMRDVPKSPKSLRQEIPPAVSAVLQTALAKDPDGRFQTADDFVRALAAKSPRKAITHRARAAIIAALGVLGIAAVLGWPSLHHAVVSTLDPNTVAVAPFTVLAPELAAWHEGMANVLSRNLDGWGPLHVTPTAATTRAAQGVVDAASAASLGEALNAGVVIFGSLYPSGPDSTRVTITVYDANTRKPIGELERRVESTRLDQATDSLTLGILTALATGHPTLGTSRIATLGARSLIASKEFLNGDQLYRRASFDSAIDHFRHATELDTAFALAFDGLGEAEAWSGNVNDASMHRLRASRLNHGLAAGDSILLSADSLVGVLELAPFYYYVDPLESRLDSALTAYTTRYPADARGWYRRADANVHFAHGMRGLATLDYFDRAINIDADMAPAYIHAVQDALTIGAITRARSYATRFLEHSTGSVFTDRMRAFLWISDPSGRSDAQLARLADTLPEPLDFLSANLAVRGEFLGDSAATLARLYRALAAAPRWKASQKGLTGDQLEWTRHAASLLAVHGQLRAARALDSSILKPLDLLALVRLGVARCDSVSRVMDGPLTSGSALSMAFWTSCSDSAGVRRTLVARSRAANAPPVDSAHAGKPIRDAQGVLLFSKLRQWDAAYTEASILLTRHDTAAALAAFEKILFATIPLEAFVRDQAIGRIDATLAASRPAGQSSPMRLTTEGDFGLDLMSRFLLLARAADHQGDVRAAKIYYSRLAAVWAHADPEFKPLVTEINAALVRLNART